MPRTFRHWPAAFVVVWGLCVATVAQGLDHVVFRQKDEERTVAGKVLTKSQDGGLLLTGPDGAIFTIEPKDLVSHKSDAEEFKPWAAAEVSRRLLKELPAGFETHTTANFVICHNTSKAYAQWCGASFERLFRAFNTFWTRQGLTLHEPEFPLVAIVFADEQGYMNYARKELGADSVAPIGYYNFQSNRMLLYDLTGSQAGRGADDRRGASAVNEMLSRPDAERTVATIVHECTHMIAYNTGLHTRYTDVPLWVSEGLAVYFETPDLKNSKGWGTIGALNRGRLATFRNYLPRRPADSLETLVGSDKRFRDTKVALEAYAEAWALNYYLLRNRPQDYVAFLKKVAAKERLIWDEPTTRLEEFRAVFGEDLKKFDAEFVRYTSKLRP